MPLLVGIIAKFMKIWVIFIQQKETMSGEEFCRLLSINKADIDKQRSLACEKNIDFVIDELLHISVVSRKIHQKLTH